MEVKEKQIYEDRGINLKILTVTLNPAIDTRYQDDKLKLNKINRVNKKIETLGGKGVDVSIVLNKDYIY